MLHCYHLLSSERVNLMRENFVISLFCMMPLLLFQSHANSIPYALTTPSHINHEPRRDANLKLVVYFENMVHGTIVLGAPGTTQCKYEQLNLHVNADNCLTGFGYQLGIYNSQEEDTTNFDVTDREPPSCYLTIAVTKHAGTEDSIKVGGKCTKPTLFLCEDSEPPNVPTIYSYAKKCQHFTQIYPVTDIH